MGTMLAMRVLKGKNLPGHMGNETVTIQNLEVVSVDVENNVILIKGNVPGPKKSLVVIKTAVKNPDVVKDTEKLVSYVEETSVETTGVNEPVEEVEAEAEETEEVQEN